MGVEGLWKVLAPAGRRIDIKTLSGKVLAIDASIWVTQFVKAMRDEQGNMVANAHLSGTYSRICKMLFQKIRPIFVFDGRTPELKRRTVEKRRGRRQSEEELRRSAARRLLQQGRPACP